MEMMVGGYGNKGRRRCVDRRHYSWLTRTRPINLLADASPAKLAGPKTNVISRRNNGFLSWVVEKLQQIGSSSNAVGSSAAGNNEQKLTSAHWMSWKSLNALPTSFVDLLADCKRAPVHYQVISVPECWAVFLSPSYSLLLNPTRHSR
jgi:hypothetical protein